MMTKCNWFDWMSCRRMRLKSIFEQYWFQPRPDNYINIVSEYQSHDKFTTQNVFSYLKSTISISKVQSSTLPRCIDLPTTNFKACGAVFAVQQ